MMGIKEILKKERQLDQNAKDIETIGNHYGCLRFSEFEDKFYWSITDWYGDDWDDIPKYLYDALLKYHNE